MWYRQSRLSRKRAISYGQYLALILSVAAIASPASAAKLTAAQQEAYRARFYGKCLDVQKIKSPDSTPEVRKIYCQCLAPRVVKEISRVFSGEEMVEFAMRGPKTPAIQARIDALAVRIGNACIAELFR